jgi:tripartite-type tricarboxylate transporter receptor subunit TctC
VALLNKAIAETLALPEVRTALEKIAVAPRSTTPQQYRDLIARDAARWKAVATAANIKLE